MKPGTAYILLPLLMLLSSAFLSCSGGDRQTVDALSHAESFLPTHPDSAALLLDSLDARVAFCRLNPSSESFSLYALLRTMTDDMLLRTAAPADSLIRPAYIYYKSQMEHGQMNSTTTTRRYARSAFYMALYFAAVDSVKQAEDLYRQATKHAEATGDWRTCYNAYFHLSRMKRWSDLDSELLLLDKAADVYNKCQDKPANLVAILDDMAYCHLSLHDTISAMACADSAYRVAAETRSDNLLADVLKCMATIHFEAGNYQTALKLQKQGMRYVTDATKPYADYALADCYMALDSLSQARQILMNISLVDDKLKYATFRKLAQIAAIAHDPEAAIMYSDSAYMAVCSLYSNSQSTKETYYADNLAKELANTRLQLRNRTNIMIAIVVCLFLLLVFVLLYRKLQQYVAELKRKHRLSLMSVEMATEQIQILERKINMQAAMIAESEAHYQQILHEKNSELRQVYESELAAYRQKLEQDRVALNSLRLYTIRQTPIYKYFISGVTYNSVSNDQWQELCSMLDACSDTFVSRLRRQYPNITDDCLHICLLNRIGFTRRQIADFMCLAEVSIKKRHQEYKHVLFDNSDRNVNFCDLIARF